MPLLGILDIVVAVFFAVHALRTGRSMFWLLVLLMFPFLGSLIYFFAEFLPDLRHSNTGRKSARAVKALVDPNRALREAQFAFERTPTVDNRARRRRGGDRALCGLRERPVREGREVPPRPGARADRGRAARRGGTHAAGAVRRQPGGGEWRGGPVARAGLRRGGRRGGRARRLRACAPDLQHHRDALRVRPVPRPRRSRRAGASAARERVARCPDGHGLLALPEPRCHRAGARCAEDTRGAGMNTGSGPKT